MKQLFLIFILLSLFAAAGAPAQEGPHASSGIGIIAPGNRNIIMGINFPMAEVIMRNTSGYRQGVIYKKDIMNLMFRQDTAGRAYRISDADLAEITFSGYCLKYFARQGDYIKVLANTTGGGYWISLSDLHHLGYVAKSWMDVLLGKKTHLFSRVDMGINLREKPDQNSAKLTLVKGRKYLIDLSGNTKGLWAEVRVSYFNNIPDRKKLLGAKPLKEWTGWMKIIDDAGYPNLWFYPENNK